jgi:hypothetical protein
MEPEWFTSPFREVRWEPLFCEQIKALAIDSKKLDHALSYLDYCISSSPETFPRIPGTPFSRAVLHIYEEDPQLPPLRIFFTYDAIHVKLICIEFV